MGFELIKKSKWKQYFKHNKEIVYYLTKILNEDSFSDNIGIEKHLPFPECEKI